MGGASRTGVSGGRRRAELPLPWRERTVGGGGWEHTAWTLDYGEGPRTLQTLKPPLGGDAQALLVAQQSLYVRRTGDWRQG